MSEVDSRFVLRGPWTDLARGDIMGKTITTDTSTGIVIVAILAILSTVGTSHLWNIMSFIYHQSRATRSLGDGLFRQQQALLRTTPPPTSLMAESVKLWWTWRRQNNNVFGRSLFLLVIAASCSVLFVAVSVASSFVVATTDLVVLVNSPLCGFMHDTDNDTMPLDTQRSLVSAVSSASLPYAQACYQDHNVSSSGVCGTYARSSIAFRSENASCPFSPEFCLNNVTYGSHAIAFDSGLIDVSDNFGMNLARHDSVQYRRRSTCTVLPLSGHSTIVNASDISYDVWGRQTFPGEEALLLHYGARPKLGQFENLTFITSLLDTNLSGGYNLGTRFYSAARERGGYFNTFEPFSDMRRTDADVTLIVLISAIQYSEPVTDPWFLASQSRILYDVISGSNRTVFAQDSIARAMGCVAQHQFCIHTKSGDRCSNLDSLPRTLNSKSWPDASSVQLSTLKLLIHSLTMYGLVQRTQVQAEQFSIGGLVTKHISDQQWIIEAKAMESAVWAALQVLMADYAVGPSVRLSELANYTAGPATTGEKQLCGSQKIRKAGGFVNINVFGTVFIVVMSLSCAILDIMLLKFLIFLSAFREALSPRIDSWVQDSVLQLQRRAYESIGEGTWSSLDKDIPLTAADEMLPTLTSQQQTNVVMASVVTRSTSFMLSHSSAPSLQHASLRPKSPYVLPQPASSLASSAPPSPTLASQVATTGSAPVIIGPPTPMTQQATPPQASAPA